MCSTMHSQILDIKHTLWQAIPWEVPNVKVATLSKLQMPPVDTTLHEAWATIITTVVLNGINARNTITSYDLVQLWDLPPHQHH